ncbi:TAP-like protein-domain-containing protein [Sordaria brevicollis]|uniref:TAP-like protein-domain-containing protein n=1 Tax=Sordaria brevicollis TaxID=83679 RepID=A0AAE0P8M5_SORBR|nr:TAP-like protein-domain-containing protein [Sordaria brevicollis]
MNSLEVPAASTNTMYRKLQDEGQYRVSSISERHCWHRITHPRATKIAWSCTAIVLATLALLSLPDLSSLAWTTSPKRPYINTLYFFDKDRKKEPGDEFNWADITPSPPPIQWQPCYDNEFDCARLDLPMDWQQAEATNDSASGRRVILAIIRLRATVPSNNSDYRGPIIFNPGGPGGSGIWSLRDHGRDLQTIVGTNHDIVSWDPRGVGASIPRIDCWASTQDRVYWDLQDPGVIDAHEGTVYDAYARAAAYSLVCERNLEASGILEHSSTLYHARDLLAILEGMGEEKLKYWGFSYGTVLGGTFAVMYPDRVERMVNDGNVDYEEWHNGTYINFLHDTDKVMEAFYTFCHSAGPDRCSFHASSPHAIKSRLDALLTKLRTHPIIIPLGQQSPSSDPTEPFHVPSLVTYSHIRRMLSTALYQPILRFPQIARVLASLEAGDALPYHQYTLSDIPPLPSSPTTCQADDTEPIQPPPFIPFEEESNPDVSSAVMCSDAAPFTSSPHDFAQYAKQLLNISSAAGAVQASFRLSCAGRTIRPRWQPLNFTSAFEDVATAHPVLFINNEFDNVTPLVSARKNAKGFKGAKVLVQRGSWGHTSLASPSFCMAKVVRKYFREGEMPEEEEECWGDQVPFGDEDADMEKRVEGSGEGDAGGDGDGELRRAVWRLSRRRSIFGRL